MTETVNAALTDLNLKIERGVLAEVVSRLVGTALRDQGAMIPTGLIQAYGGKGVTSAYDGQGDASYTGIPDGWLPCDGRAISQTSTADGRLGATGTRDTTHLFAAIGHAFEPVITVLPNVEGETEDRIYLPFHHFANGEEVKVRTVDAAGNATADPMDPSYYVEAPTATPHIIRLHTSALMNATVGLSPAAPGSELALIRPNEFSLPDLRGRMPLGSNKGDASGYTSKEQGQELRLAERLLGHHGGDEYSQAHYHLQAPSGSSRGTLAAAYGNENSGIRRSFQYVEGGKSTTYADKVSTSGTGFGENMPPFQILHYIIKA